MTALKRALISVIGSVAALTGIVAAQPVVIAGTGNPDVDVPAVQAAVDKGGHVFLMGHFSFDRIPTKDIDHLNGRTILVTRAVAISGTVGDNGEITTIDGGDNPFAVDAPDASVTIERLHFVRPKEDAIFVRAVSGLVIAHCWIEGVVPMPDPTNLAGGNFGDGIHVVTTTTLFPPTPADPGQPENVSGTLSILDNDIDVGGTAADNTVGIVVFAVGKSPDREVDLYISGNRVSNLTERPIEVNQAGGRVQIERNTVTTGTVVGPTSGAAPDVIHVVGVGSYLVAHNTILCEWATGAGIRVQGTVASAGAGVIVEDNDVTMSAPDGAVFGANSAGIEIRGFTRGNAVLNNRIRGRARAALAVVGQNGGIPANNTFVSNDLTDFQSSVADVSIDAGVPNTVIVGRPATIQDQGSGTVVVPMP